MSKPYKVKEIFYTLQGEGFHTGRPAVFCRFSKCNLWNGREEDRKGAICNFCDTDINGTDGLNGGVYKTATELAEKICELWPNELGNRFVVCTGGEPALQVNEVFVEELKSLGFEVAIETNGTLPLPDNIDWVCCSPKGKSNIVIKNCDELKVVFPQEDAMPDTFNFIEASFYYLTPKSPIKTIDEQSFETINLAQETIKYCLENPKWRLNLQTHKIINIA